MKCRHLAGLAALGIAITLGAANASAQTPNQPPPSTTPPSTPTQPPPGPPPPPSRSAGGSAPVGAAGVARVHFKTEKDKKVAHLYIHRSNDSWTLLCDSPCTVDVPFDGELRATLGQNDDDPHTFAITRDLGTDVNVLVRPASSGPLIAGIVLMGVGGVFVLTGLLFVAEAALTKDVSTDFGTTGTSTNTSKTVSDVYRVTGYVCIGLGAAAAVSGLIVLLTRNQEPRTVFTPYQDDNPKLHARAGTFLGDVSVLSRTGPMPIVAPATPLSYSFAF